MSPFRYKKAFYMVNEIVSERLAFILMPRFCSLNIGNILL